LEEKKMRISTLPHSDVKNHKADALITFAFEGEKEPLGKWRNVSEKLSDALKSVEENEGFSGKEEKAVSSYLPKIEPFKRIIFSGLGKKETFDLDVLRRASASAYAIAKATKSKSICVLPFVLPNFQKAEKDYIRAIVESIILTSYEFNNYKTEKEEKDVPLERVDFITDGKATREITESIRYGEIVSNATNFARNLINEPPSFMTPQKMAEIAKAVCKKNKISIEIFDEKEMAKRNMGGILGVASGSPHPPRLVHMKYTSPAATKTIAIVGKGLTFDSGGLGLKPAPSMLTMKDDMSGAAMVIGIFTVINELKPKINVHGIFSATENIIGGNAYKPGDILRTINGKTIEVVHTDAEGRITLADTLGFASNLKPEEIIDVATLTGACVVALGTDISGILGNDQNLIDKIIEKGKETGEKIWQLPLEKRYAKFLKSDVADVKNVTGVAGGGPGAGTITGALFLEKFVSPKLKWVHIDIAGTAFTEKGSGYNPTGGTGVMVRTLLQYLIEN